MRAASLLSLVLMTLLGVQAATAQRQPRSLTVPPSAPRPATPYRITGTVVNAVDQSVVSGCRVAVALVVRGNFTRRQASGDPDSAHCDEHGHFSVPLPSMGSWRLTASARGFITEDYDEHESFTTAIVLTAAQPTMDIQFRIHPEGTITGTVVDEVGEPVRTAQVSLQSVPAAGPDGVRPPSRMRSSKRTDDRGVYEFTGVSPGAYRIMVQAQPWYATSQPRSQSSDTASVDPSLDFAYPLTWFPGVDDLSFAETMTLQAGETRQADFHLAPIPSAHLLIAPPAGSASTNGRPVGIFPMVQRVVPGSSSLAPLPIVVQNDAQGQIDVGGLAPGTYRVSIAGQNQQSSSSVVEVTAGSVRTLDSGVSSAEAKVSIVFDGISDADMESAPVDVRLVDSAGGIGVSPAVMPDGGLTEVRRVGRRNSRTDRSMEVLPGRYEVVLQGRPNVYLTGITAKGAEAAGRFVTLSAGASTLTLHVASGRASISGVATFQGKPSVGAMVMLVPTTIEDRNALRVLIRDQTNTDGSFDLDDVIPGQYILVAIDHGWHINWNDPSTLRSYLTQGVPVELTSGANLKQSIEAQTP